MQNRAISNGGDEQAPVDLGALSDALRSTLGLRLRPVASLPPAPAPSPFLPRIMSV